MKFLYVALIGVLLMSCGDPYPRDVPDAPTESLPGKSGDAPGRQPKPSQVEEVPSLEIEHLSPSLYRLVFNDVPHPGPRNTLVAGWGYAQIHVRAARGTIDAELVEENAPGINKEADSDDYFSLLVYPDQPSVLATGGVGVPTRVAIDVLVSHDADVRISAYPSNGECVLDARIVGGEFTVTESARLWRWTEPNERHFCTRPDEQV